MSMKNPLTLAGIEPATFRFVAQHLNHCATAVPRLLWSLNFCHRLHTTQPLVPVLSRFNPPHAFPGPNQHYMARLDVVDGRYRLQMRSVAANVLNKH